MFDSILQVIVLTMNGVESVEMTGKGIGLVAKRDFHVGDVVLREPPLLWMPSKVFDAENDVTERWLDKKINAMTSQQRAAFYELSDCRFPEDKTTLGIFFTNCMTFIQDSAALFPMLARANHSCQSNTEFITRPALEVQDLVATRFIAKGEEVTTNYMPASGEGSGDAKTRMEYLREWYGFRCVCPSCLGRDQDPERRKIRKLQQQGLESLNVYELEELADGLDRINSKLVYREQVNAMLYDHALKSNDRVLAAKSFSSVYLYKTVTDCPRTDDWKSDYEQSQAVPINGKFYLFPPSKPVPVAS